MVEESPPARTPRRIAIGCWYRPLMRLWLVLAALGTVTLAQGQESRPMTFSGYASPVPAIMGTAWTIFGDGVIDEGTTDRLQIFLTSHKVPYSSSINLNSDGGSLAEGIKLGRLIRQSQLFTYVGRSGDKIYDIKSGECYSACALAFLGGVFRFNHKGSLYGVHRFYSSPTTETITSDNAQIISAAIIEYIQTMGVNPSLFTFMTQAGSNEIKLLSDKEQLHLNVVDRRRSAEPIPTYRPLMPRFGQRVLCPRPVFDDKGAWGRSVVVDVSPPASSCGANLDCVGAAKHDFRPLTRLRPCRPSAICSRTPCCGPATRSKSAELL
jgi:hypothetical protein